MQIAMRDMINRLLRPLRLQVRPSREQRRKPIVLIGDGDAGLMDRFAPYTMTDRMRQYALIRAMHYLDEARIEGDFVECGVWRGGSTMIAKACRAEPVTVPRRFYLYDTFEGMTAPTADDYSVKTGITAQAALDTAKRGKNVKDTLIASVDEVKSNFEREGLADDTLVFKAGRVEETLLSDLPEKIALLRLDTDWYASTALELEKLYPRIVKGGVIIIDDYSTWAGARKAADEYFAKAPVLLVPTGSSGVIGVKA